MASKRISLWKNIAKNMLPLRYIVSPNLTVSLESIQESNLDDAVEILKTSSDTGDGLSVDEFDRYRSIADWMKSQCGMVVLNDSNKEILGTVIVRNSPLCRSLNPVYNSGYVALKKGSSRSVGLGAALLYRHWYFSNLLGYQGSLGRTGINSRSIVPLKKSGVRLMGIVPNSINQLGIGWLDDVVLYSRYTEDFKEGPEPVLPKFDETNIPIPQEASAKFSSVTFPPLILQQTSRPHSELSISMATSSDIVQVERAIHEAACKGNGFCMDELTPEGFFNAKLLWDKNILVAKYPGSGEVLAAVLFGPSALCRSPGTPQVGGYMLVKEKYRNQGMGTALMDYCISLAQFLNYKGILIDVLAMNYKAQCMAIKSGFKIVGTLPNCGYVKGRGLTDSIMFYHNFSRNYDWSATVRFYES